LNFKIVKKVVDAIGKYRIKNPKKLMVYGIFVLLSTVFWLLSALSENYSTTIRYPVKFTNLPKKSVLINELPDKVDLKVEAHGFTLLRYKISRSIIPLNINVKNYTLLKVPESESRYFLLSRYTQQKITNQLRDDIKVIEIQPDSFIFEFTEIIRKQVVIKPSVKYDLQRQYLVKEVKCEPDSMLVSGPKYLIDTLRYLETKAMNLGNLDHSIKRNVALKSIDRISSGEKRVQLSLEIEKYTQTSFQIPVEVVNAPDEYNLKLFPEQVSVSFLVALSDFEKVKPYHFKLIAKYEDSSSRIVKKTPKLKVELKKYPSFVSSIDIYPTQLDYLLEKR
jgi:hypothetical protein